MTQHVFIFAPHWGSAHLSRDAFIHQVKEAGFDGIEMSLPMVAVERDAWCRAIEDAGLLLIAQQWETALHADFDDHKQALAAYLFNACAAQPLFVNTHTGKDFYSFAQNSELLDLTESISLETGVPIVHEIHRSRFSGHPMLLLPYLQQRPSLAFNADLSHWCCACESLLEDQQQTLAQVFPHVQHIHARVGNSQGPQVNDFRAPEHANALQQHLAWWDAIIELRRHAGVQQITITPEFGPAPYTQTLPYTNQVVSDAWELNVAMLRLLRERYA
ncbi:sugar phosphate isomerase/epimerase family protein [Undibacterium sp. RuRC25W]|uniref:sugar phosphate isomerase/epimerase family protein n=1 Tax=Undibacterium sp. RuRC25W TaxID=3413047 RepID=UPI003BF34C3A